LFFLNIIPSTNISRIENFKSPHAVTRNIENCASQVYRLGVLCRVRGRKKATHKVYEEPRKYTQPWCLVAAVTSSVGHKVHNTARALNPLNDKWAWTNGGMRVGAMENQTLWGKPSVPLRRQCDRHATCDMKLPSERTSPVSSSTTRQANISAVGNPYFDAPAVRIPYFQSVRRKAPDGGGTFRGGDTLRKPYSKPKLNVMIIVGKHAFLR
jgi:hypothetical protein